MASLPIVFPSAKAANAIVAGIPCAARAAMGREGEVVLVVPGGWEPSLLTLAELARLSRADCTVFAGEEALGELAVDGLAPDSEPRPVSDILASPPYTDSAAASHAQAQAAHRIVAATGKPTDGLVSRTINRPVSQFLSSQLLRFAGMRPIHATIAASLIGVVMALALFLGGVPGLYAGAVLFQLASMVDGVDGEIARATHRSSKLGATLDTAGDAMTNLAFVGGVVFNLWQQGAMLGAQVGLLGLVWLALGLTLLGTQSLLRGGPLSFDALKHEASAKRSPFLQTLGKLASRDVYALAFAVLVVIRLAEAAMIAFALAVLAWLGLVLVATARPLWQR